MSQASGPILYGAISGLSDSATDAADRNTTSNCSNNQMGATCTMNQSKAGEMREISGRSRAILKQYFDEVDAYTFPVGQRTVAFL